MMEGEHTKSKLDTWQHNVRGVLARHSNDQDSSQSVHRKIKRGGKISHTWGAYSPYIIMSGRTYIVKESNKSFYN